MGRGVARCVDGIRGQGPARVHFECFERVVLPAGGFCGTVRDRAAAEFGNDVELHVLSVVVRGNELRDDVGVRSRGCDEDRSEGEGLHVRVPVADETVPRNGVR